MTAVVRITDLQAHRGHSHILQGVSIELPSGVTGVIGRNGMGKTTLAESVMGMLRPTGGSIVLDGVELAGKPSFRIARAGIALVPQGRRLFRSLTVAEHLQLQGRRVNGHWNRARVLEVFPRLAERLHNGATALSGGEQQMLAIARALMQNPKVLILDEPSEGLAPVIVHELGRNIRNLGDAGLAILLIEQNLELVLGTISDEVAVMENGRITERIAVDTLSEDRVARERILGVALSEQK